MAAGQAEFAPEQARQIARVLRLRPGDQVSIFDGTGREVVASLDTVSIRRATARILHESPRLPSPPLKITLAQVVPRGPVMDLIVAKATELGVARIVPVEGERSVRHARARTPRWRRIVQEAAEQCGRTELPEVVATSSLHDFLLGHEPEAPLLACVPSERAQAILAACHELRGVSGLSLLVGGEGGFSPGEIEWLHARGARQVRLGPRLLRAGTAALAGLAIIQAILGDWQRPEEFGMREQVSA
jgi:16S rRNA (uracil1498-N3)-methyltransferase